MYEFEIDWKFIHDKANGIVKKIGGYSGWDNYIYFSEKGVFFTHEYLFWLDIKLKKLPKPFLIKWKIYQEIYNKIDSIKFIDGNPTIILQDGTQIKTDEVSEKFLYPEDHFTKEELKSRDVFILNKKVLKEWLKLNKVHYYVLKGNEIGVVWFNQKYEKLTNVRRKGYNYPKREIGIYKRDLKIFVNKILDRDLNIYVNDKNWIIATDDEVVYIADVVRHVDPEK